MDRLAQLIDAAGRNASRAYEAASSLSGPFPTPNENASTGDEPYGRVDTLRSMLDELERRLSNTAFALGELENTLSPSVKSTVSGAAQQAGGGW
jgi:hypothetical protein